MSTISPVSLQYFSIKSNFGSLFLFCFFHENVETIKKNLEASGPQKLNLQHMLRTYLCLYVEVCVEGAHSRLDLYVNKPLSVHDLSR